MLLIYFSCVCVSVLNFDFPFPNIHNFVFCRATLLPAIRRFLPDPWNDNLIVWRFPYFRCMYLKTYLLCMSSVFLWLCMDVILWFLSVPFFVKLVSRLLIWLQQ